MRQRPVLVGGAMAAVGVALLPAAVAVMARGGRGVLDPLRLPLLGVVVGVLLVLLGVGLIRDARRFPPGYREHQGDGAYLPYTPAPDGGAGGQQSPADGGGDWGGGGGGNCGGSGGGS
ncbi:hypothetical protein [Micromonospora sp. DT47]|uniref:hypothetical protein n=1 Tax=Micromonospora sp. DT47 TaxID=3393431 RepID=UPI003CF2E965